MVYVPATSPGVARQWCPLCGVTRISQTHWICEACVVEERASAVAVFLWIHGYRHGSVIPRRDTTVSDVWQRQNRDTRHKAAEILAGRRPLEVP